MCLGDSSPNGSIALFALVFGPVNVSTSLSEVVAGLFGVVDSLDSEDCLVGSLDFT